MLIVKHYLISYLQPSEFQWAWMSLCNIQLYRYLGK